MSRWALDGKQALVTGSTKGIGAAIARELLSLGARVLVVARGREHIDRVVREWNAEPGSGAGLAAFLCMSGASYITGQTIGADGGFLAWRF